VTVNDDDPGTGTTVTRTFAALYTVWMVDIHGTTVTICLTGKPRAPESEVAEARLVFTLTTDTWGSG
jgi:hypothetical protein